AIQRNLIDAVTGVLGFQGGALGLACLITNSLDRKRHRKRRSLPLARTFGLNCAAVQLRQMAHYRQTQSKTAILPFAAGVGLTEAVEDKGEKFGVNSNSRIAHFDLNLRAGAFQTQIDAPVSRSELGRV